MTPSPSRARRSYYDPLYRARLLRSVLLIVAVAVGGTLGYHILERWTLLDSLYMTVITMGTIGYGEIHPMDSGGHIFTMLLIVTSLGIAGYAITTIGSFIIEGELYRVIRGRQMDKRITNLMNHVIICGGGRVGRAIVAECHKTGTPFVLIEQDPDAVGRVLEIGDIPYLEGDATRDDHLTLAGIGRARGLVAALGEDKDNVFIVLSARSLNPALRIIARVTDEKNIEKLRKAGADEVVSPNSIGGLRMASVMLRPAVVTFLDQMLRREQTLRVEEVAVKSLPDLAGKTLDAAAIGRETGMLVLAMRTAAGEYRFNPPGATVLHGGDVLIVMGSPDQITALGRTA